MEKEIRSELVKTAKGYTKDEFSLFTTELGWQDWMNEFSSDPENENYVLSEGELRNIESELREIFEIAQIRTIDELNEGDEVTDDSGEYAVVKLDIESGNKYYANYNCEYNQNAITVSDIDTDYLGEE